MSVSVMMIVLNEEFFIEACLKGIYDFADEIVIVEGSVPYMRWLGLTNNVGGSIDKTENIIRQFIDTYDSSQKKIKYFVGKSYESKIEIRNLALQNCTSDWVMLVDSDEFYTDEDLLKIKYRLNQLSRNERNVLGITYPFKQFWSMTLYNDERVVMERIFKRHKTAIYAGKPKDGQNIYINNQKLWGSNRTKHYDDIFCYHYSPFLINQYMFERLKNKALYYGARQIDIKTQEEFESSQTKIIKMANNEQIRLMRLVLETKECGKTEHPVAFKNSNIYQDFYGLIY